MIVRKCQPDSHLKIKNRKSRLVFRKSADMTLVLERTG